MKIHSHMEDGVRRVYTLGEGFDCPAERGCWHEVDNELAAVLLFDCAHCGDGDALRVGDACAYCGLEREDEASSSCELCRLELERSGISFGGWCPHR